MVCSETGLVDYQHLSPCSALEHFVGFGAVVHRKVSQRFERLPGEVTGIDGVSV